MNRRDFIKTFVATAAIAPVVVITKARAAGKTETIPLAVDTTKFEAALRQCQDLMEYEYYADQKRWSDAWIASVEKSRKP